MTHWTNRVETMSDPLGGTVLGLSGRRYPYRLERARRWNIGLRRHSVELTGRIILHLDGRLSYHDNWQQCLDAVDDYERRENIKPILETTVGEQ